MLLGLVVVLVGSSQALSGVRHASSTLPKLRGPSIQRLSRGTVGAAALAGALLATTPPASGMEAVKAIKWATRLTADIIDTRGFELTPQQQRDLNQKNREGTARSAPS